MRIDVTATSSGMATAGSVPKTNRRMMSAPAPPISASVSTLGPPASPCDSKTGSRPVRCTVTPVGVVFRKAARTSFTGGFVSKVAFPGG